MDDEHGRLIHNLRALAHPPDEIDIFQIHEVTLIESANLAKNAGANQEEAPGHCRDD
jgi:hypothetical protein